MYESNIITHGCTNYAMMSALGIKFGFKYICLGT